MSFLLESINERFNRFAKELKNCKNANSVDSVHDLRVSIRRLDAALDLLSNFIEDNSLVLVRKEIKSILQPFGKLRDIHVQQQWINTIYKDHGSGLKKYISRLNKKEKKIENTLIELAKNFRPVLTQKMIDHLGYVLFQKEQINNFSFPMRAYEIMLIRYGLVKDAERHAMDENDTDALHQLRIAFKHYRYTAELLKPLFASDKNMIMERMHSFQTLLGEIHDFDVLSKKFHKFIQKKNRTLLEIEDLRISINILLQKRRGYYKQFHDFPELQKDVFHPDNLIDSARLAEVELVLKS